MNLGKQWWGVVSAVLIAAYFVTTRWAAFFQPYHQDEYKWALAANPAFNMWDSIPHPVLAEWTYRIVGGWVGYDHLRIVPIVISAVTLMLLFWAMRRQFGALAAFAGSALYAVCAFSLLGSVQIDIDGAFLPFFALLAYIGYSEALTTASAGTRRASIALLAGSIVLGFFTKLSFVLVPAALAVDFALRSPRVRAFVFRPAVLLGALGALGVLGGALVLLWNHIGFLRYVDNFLAFSGRSYSQVAIQTAKALFLMSPVLPLAMILGMRYLKKLSFWFIFIAVNVLFYYVVFDFTHRTFDRYLLFFVLPGAWIAGATFASIIGERFAGLGGRIALSAAAAAAALAGIAHVIFSGVHSVVPLIPKSAFLSAIAHGDWNILIPMAGGSGPLGFYLPVDGLAFLWVVGAAAFLVLVLPYTRRIAWAGCAVLIAVFFVHSVFVTVEYVSGAYYGSAPAVLSALVSDIRADADGGDVLTYNDIGAYELNVMGRYAARFYPHEEFVPDNVQKLLTHTGSFLVVDMPALNPDSVYGQFFAVCDTLASSTSGLISGSYLSCGPAARALLTQ